MACRVAPAPPPISKRAQLIAEAEAAAAAAKAAAAPASPAEAVAVETAAPAGEATDGSAAAEAAASESPPAGESAETEAAAAPEATNGSHKHERHDRQDKADKAEKGEKPGQVTFAGPLCTPCADVARRLTDRPVACGISGCKRKWIWKADDQIQAFAAGKPNEPPRRMCDGCRASFGKLLDREVRCRTSGCKKTWTWSRFDQLDACVAEKPAPKAPSRMCESCFDAFAKTKDIERPCRKNGCKRTWTDKRGAQLARMVRGKMGDPYPQYCSECQKELGDLAEREITCKTEGCNGTWTWTKEQQLAAGVRPQPKDEGHQGHAQVADAGRPQVAAQPVVEVEVIAAPTVAEGEAAAAPGTEAPAVEAAPEAATATEAPAAAAAVPAGQPGQRGPRNKDKRRRKQRQIQPPERLCHACSDFLKEKKTLEIPCSQCATPIFWPPESQLQTHLGNWASPSLCGACKRDATEAARRAAKEAIRAHAIEASVSHAVAGLPDTTTPEEASKGEPPAPADRTPRRKPPLPASSPSALEARRVHSASPVPSPLRQRGPHSASGPLAPSGTRARSASGPLAPAAGERVRVRGLRSSPPGGSFSRQAMGQR